jgi:predicted  nucleic acid-binding Zn-ribbon protein
MLLLTAGITTTFAQNNMEPDPKADAEIKVTQDKEKNILNVSYISSERSDLKIRIKNTAGKTVYSMHLVDQRMQHTKSLNMSAYEKGIYFIEIDSQRTQQVDRIEL